MAAPRPTSSLRPAARFWTIVLAGPVVGTTYFWVVYLLAEASCSPDLALTGRSTVRVAIVAGAVAAVATLVAVAVWSVMRAGRAGGATDATEDDALVDAALVEDDRRMTTIGLILAGLFVVFVLFVAAPVLGSTLC